MKAKYLRYTKKALPALIVVPAMMQLSVAGTIIPDAAGNIVVPTDFDEINGTDFTIDASGGTTPPNTITVDAGAVLTGDAALLNAVNVTAADYTLNNSGSLTGEIGVNATGFDVGVVNNAGALIQATVGDAIVAGGGSTIDNHGQILGEVNAIHFETLGGTVNNWGLIGGNTGNGIEAVSDLQLWSSGTIGGVTGINVAGGNSIITIAGGWVTGNGGTAIQLGADANTVYLNGGWIGGDIIAAGTANVLNAASATVDGSVSGFDAINIAPNGDVRIYGDISGTAPVITTGPGSWLGGSGLWTATANLAADSHIYASASPGVYDSGVLQIAGDVNHAPGSSIYTGINPDVAISNDGTDHGLIQSTSGVYDATGAIVDLDVYGLEAIRNGDYVIVEAAGGTVVGGDNTVTYRGLTDSVLGNYFTTVSADSGDLVLTTDHNFSDLPGLSANESVLGEIFDQFMVDESALASGATSNQEFRNLIGEMDFNTLTYTQQVLAGILAPVEQVLGATGSLVNSNYRVHRLTQDHLAMARDGGERTVTTTTPATRDAKGGMIEGTTTTDVVSGGKGNVWGTYSHDWQDFKSTDYDGEVDAFTVGFDYQIAPNLLLGLLVDGSKGDLEHAAGGTDIHSIRAAIYGTWGGASGLYVDFLAGYGDHDLDLTDATSFQGMATVGYTLQSGGLRHGPFAGLEYQKVEVDGFSANSVFPVEFDDYDAESFRGLIGYRLDGSYGRFTPYLSVAYAHEFSDEPYSTTGSISGYEFGVEGYEPGSAVLISLGTGVSLTEALSLNVGYRGEIPLDDEGVENHGGSIGLNYRF